MILFCLLFGKKPASFYQTYRKWYLKHQGYDVELNNLPFVPPSQSFFLYDPFSIDFDNPFDSVNIEELTDKSIKHKNVLEDLEGQFRSKDGSFNFATFMKCISDLSYGSLFSDGNSKKFNYSKMKEEKETDLAKNNEEARKNIKP